MKEDECCDLLQINQETLKPYKGKLSTRATSMLPACFAGIYFVWRARDFYVALLAFYREPKENVRYRELEVVIVTYL
jgi:hypothetical protein